MSENSIVKSITIGSNGYIGRHLAALLERSGYKNYNYDLHDLSIDDRKNYSKLDVTEKKDFHVLDPDSDVIFFFSGLTGTNEGFEKYEQFISVNEIGLLNLLTWMRESGSKARVVFPSTRLVYKGCDNVALRENDPKEPLTIYAVNKLVAENILIAYNNAFDIDFNVLRICVPYGSSFSDGYSYGTLGFFLNRAKKGEDLTIFGDGSIRRTFTHIEDICRIIMNVARSSYSKNMIFNIGGENMSLLDVARHISIRYGVKIKFVDFPDMHLRLETGDTVFDDHLLKKAGFAKYEHKLKDTLF